MQKRNLSIISFIVIIVFYSVLISISDFNEFLKHLNLLKFELIPIILVLHFFVIVLRIVRQKFLFDSINVQLSFKEHFWIHLSGLALIMSPGGLGQSVKAVYLKKNNDVQYGKSISLTLSERFYDLFSVIPVIFVASLFVNSYEAILSSAIAFIILIIVLGIIRNQKIYNFIISKLPKIWILKSIVENSEELFNILKKLMSGKTFFYSFLIGICSWIIGAVAFYFSFVAFNVNLTFFETTLVSLVPIVIGTLSLLPGGIIATEITMLGLLSSYGLDDSLSSAIILFSRITSIWFLTIIGIFATRKVLPKKL